MAVNVATPEATLRLLRGRLDVTGRGSEPFTVSELLEKFLPYRLARSELGLDTKPEYDLTVLRLLDSQRLERSSALAEAVSAELDRGEPTIEFLSRWGEERLTIHGAGGSATVARPASGPPPPHGDEASGRTSVPRSARNPSRSAGTRAGEGGESEPGPTTPPRPSDSPTDVTARSCRGCERPLPRREELRFCPFCGRDQTVARCAACGEQIDEAWAFCPRCGRKVLT